MMTIFILGKMMKLFLSRLEKVKKKEKIQTGKIMKYK
jgi:hypothetical protein